MGKKKYKYKLKPKIKIALLKFNLVIFLVIFIISVRNILVWNNDNKSNIKETNEIMDKVDIVEKEDVETVEIIENIDEPQESMYYSYIKMKLIDVNFDELKSINDEVVGWIKVEGTTINYPFVHTSNNDYYLNHSFDKSSNGAGWVFMDYRNKINLSNKNTILYAHGRTNGRMFGDLKNILSNNWLNDKNNFVVKLSTNKENTLWQVFSVYRIDNTSDYIQTEFSDDNEFLNWGNMLLNRSSYNFNTSLNSNDRIITLSTCYNDYEKVVLHAKLIKLEKK